MNDIETDLSTLAEASARATGSEKRETF